MKNNAVKLASLLLIGAALLLSGCVQGPSETREEDVSDFNRVSIETFGELLISQGSTESLRIDAPRDYLRYLTAEVDDGTLTIKTRRGYFGTLGQSVTYTLTVKDLNEVSFSGAGSIKIFALNTDDFTVELNGAGSVEIDDLQADSLTVELNSAGAVVIAGRVGKQDVNLNGLGSYEAGDLQSDETSIRLSGAGSAVVWAEDKLNVEVSGVGSVSYFGSPVLTQSISGLGSVNSKGER